MKKQRWIIVLVCVFASLLWTTAAAGDSLSARIGKHATLLEGGQAVQVRVSVTCDPASEVLEAFVYVTQDGIESDFAFLPVQCTGKPERFTVTASTFEEDQFHNGNARASAYVLLTDDTTVSPTRIIKIKSGKP